MNKSIDFYQDVSLIHRVSLENVSDAGKTQEDKALESVAKQFESLFLAMMLKQMRQAGDVWNEEGLFSSHEQKFIRTLHDEALTEQLASQTPLGLAQMLVKQLASNA